MKNSEGPANESIQSIEDGKTVRVSPRKVAANRQNALKSTGPRTRRGKEYSRKNAIKHGLFARHPMEFVLLGEDPHEYEELLSDLLDQYQPIGRPEQLEVERIALCWWRLKRVRRQEIALNRAAFGDVGRKELIRQVEYCQKLNAEEEAMILQLRKATEEIEATGELSQDPKQKILAICPNLEAFWSSIERATQESLRNPVSSKAFQKFSPKERPLAEAVITISVATRFIEYLGNWRATGVIEYATAQHVIPDREDLDRILRYETAIERNLGRATDRLERLQRRRKGEPVFPPMSVRLTQ